MCLPYVDAQEVGARGIMRVETMGNEVKCIDSVVMT